MYPFPLSFASLDTHGNGIAESPWLTDTSKTSLQVPLNLADDATELKEELEEDLVLYVVSF